MDGDLMDWLETDDFDVYEEDPYDTDDYDEDYEEEYSEFALPGLLSPDPIKQFNAIRKLVKPKQSARHYKRPIRFPAGRPSTRIPLRPRVYTHRQRIPDQRVLQKTRADIEKVNLNNKVQADIFSRALHTQGKRIGRNESALALTKVMDELQERFPDWFDDEVIKTLAPLAPLLVLQPSHEEEKGIESLLFDPRFFGPALSAGIALAARNRDQKQTIRIYPEQVPVLNAGNKNTQLSAVVLDRHGQPVNPQPAITWTSITPGFATIDQNGLVTRTNAGTAIVSATTAGVKAATVGITVQ